MRPLTDKTTDQLVQEVIDHGYELEGIMYNGKFGGYPGFDTKTLGKQRNATRKRMIQRINILDARGVNVFTMDEYTMADGTVVDLEYPMQFI